MSSTVKKVILVLVIIAVGTLLWSTVFGSAFESAVFNAVDRALTSKVEALSRFQGESRTNIFDMEFGKARDF